MLCWFLPCSSFTRRSDMWFGDEGKWFPTCTFNWNKCMVSRSIHKLKHDNRIDPQEAPISLLFRKFVWVIAQFVVIFGINTTSDISKLLYVISRAFRRVKFETILKYHEWYLCQMSRTNHAIICLYYHPQKVCNFHM